MTKRAFFFAVTLSICFAGFEATAASPRITLSGTVLLREDFPDENFSRADATWREDNGPILEQLEIYEEDDFYDPTDPLSDLCSVPDDHPFGANFADISLVCGKTYELTIWGQACSSLQNVQVAFTSLPVGYMLEFKDVSATTPFNNRTSVRITGIQFKTWKVSLKPKRVLFTKDPVTADGRSQVQAKLGFQHGSSPTPGANWFTSPNPVWSIVGDDLGCTIDPNTGFIRVGTESGEIAVRATDIPNNPSRFVSGSLRVGCAFCEGSDACKVGYGIVGNFRNALAVSMGDFSCDKSFMGSIQLKLTGPLPALTTPAGLAYNQDSFDNKLPEIIREPGPGPLRQVLAPQSLADIVTVAGGYEIRLYLPQNAGVKDGNGYYQPAGSPFKVWKVTSVVANTQFTIQEDPAGVNITSTFTWLPADGAWTVNKSNLRQEKKIVQNGAGGSPPEVPGSRRNETMEISGSPIASRVTRTYATLSLNGGTLQRPDVLVEERVDGRKADEAGSPANADQVTLHYYAATATADGHEKLQRVHRPDGSWEHYEYDGSHRLSATYSTWLDSTPPAPDVVPNTVPNRKTVYSYVAHAGSGDPGTDTKTPRQIDVYVDTSGGGTLNHVSRSFVVLLLDNSVFPPVDVRKDISGSSSGAAWNTAANPVTTLRTYAGGPFKGSLRAIWRPDGTRSVYSYTETSEEVREGAPGGGVDTVTDGTKTVTTRTAQGELQSTEKFDIVTGKKLLSDVWSVPDSSGRFTLLTHLDGTTETYTYDCCNVTQIKNRDGATTVFTPDALKRIWKTKVHYQAALTTGIETRNTFDADGNITKITRVGTDSTMIDIMPLREYDRGGRVILERNASGGDTTFVEGSTGAGGRMLTTTHPDTGTRIEEYYKDGRLKKVHGTAAQPVQYDYGIENGQLFSKETKLNSLGALTTEWTKSFMDFLGRSYKVVFPDNAYTQKFFKDNGQLWKDRDPDGVITVYTYDPRGDLTHISRGLKTDPATPPGSLDVTGEHPITEVTELVGTYTETPTTYDTVLTRTREWTTLGTGANIVSSEIHTSITPPTPPQKQIRQWHVEYPNDSFKAVTKTLIQYGTGSRSETVTFPDNSYQISSYSYSRLSSVTRYMPGAVVIAQTTYQYDTHGRLWKSIDIRSGTTTFSYNNADLVVSVTAPPAASGQQAQTRATVYDQAGRSIQFTETDGAIEYTRYYKNGLPKLTWGARAYPSGYEYDAQGRLTKLHTWRSFTAPNPAESEPALPTGSVATVLTYHPDRGWLQNKRYTDNIGPDYTYTAAGRPKVRSWWRTLSGGGRLTTTYTYDFEVAGDNPNRKVGYLARIDYNDGGQMIVTPGLTFDFDRRARARTVVQATTPAITTALAWHPSGALDSESYAGVSHFLDALSVVSDNVDPANRLRRESLEARNGPAVIGGTVVTYAYDSASRLQSVTSAGLGLWGIPASPPFSATYGYVPNSSLIGTTTFKQGANTRLTATAQYDLRNRVQTLTPAATASGQPSLSRSYVYNALNQPVLRSDGDSSSWRYEYDTRGQLVLAKHSSPNAELIPGQQFEYAYDSIGNRLLMREGGNESGGGLRQTTYAPNNLNQYSTRSLSAADRKVDIMGLALVANGTPTAVTINGAAPDFRRGEYFWKALAGSGSGPNWLPVNIVADSSSASGALYIQPQNETFVYDLDGNLTGDARWEYSYDAENRLARMQTQVAAAAIGVPPKRIRFSYDYQGRLVRRELIDGTYNGGIITWNTAPHADVIFLYDGSLRIAALAADRSLHQGYVWGLDVSGTIAGAGGVGGLVMFRRAVGTYTETYFPTVDGNGNVTGLVKGEDAYVTGTAGTVAARYEYGPFGQLLRISGEPVAADNPFRFSTKPQDDDSDLLHYENRVYNPSIGRWLNRDPIAERGGLNVYGFVENDPVSDIDPLGLYPGVPGHGNPTSPIDAVNEIRRLQMQADTAFDKGLVRKAAKSDPWEDSASRNRKRFTGIIGVGNSTPGGRLNTDTKNRFVFTCKYGWIDMGHFFRNASFTYSLWKPTVAAMSGFFEGLQSSYFSDSAFSVEDLESNYLGRQFGNAIHGLDARARRAKDASDAKTRGRYVTDPRTQKVIPASLFGNIASQWEKLLKDAGAVNWDPNIRLGGQSVQELIKQDMTGYRSLSDGGWDAIIAGSRPDAFTRQGGMSWQKQQYLWKCLCDGDKPRLPALRY